MHSADASRVEQLRQQLLHNHPRRRKIVGDESGRKVNVWRADEQQLSFALDRDVQLGKVEFSEACATSASAAGHGNCESIGESVTNSKDAGRCATLRAAVSADAFKASFKAFRQAAVPEITRAVDQGGLGAFDARAAAQTLAAGGQLADNVEYRQVAMRVVHPLRRMGWYGQDSENCARAPAAVEEGGVHEAGSDGTIGLAGDDQQDTTDVVADVFSFKSHPGLFVLRGVFTEPLAKEWMLHVASMYTAWPGHRSNVSHCYVPTGGVVSAKEVDEQQGSQPSSSAKFGSRLAWLTLGYHFNWTARTYDRQERGPFPLDLLLLCRGIVGAVARAVQCPDVAAFSSRECSVSARSSIIQEDSCFSDVPFTPSAAIVNFYDAAKHCSMGGHLDDREEDMTQPVVSLSFGLPAVFLMGGRTRDTTPLATILRHGDIVIMGGEARAGYHGVPRIIEEHTEEVRQPVHENLHGTEAGNLEDVLSGRVNVNVRQVYSDDSALV